MRAAAAGHAAGGRRRRRSAAAAGHMHAAGDQGGGAAIAAAAERLRLRAAKVPCAGFVIRASDVLDGCVAVEGGVSVRRRVMPPLGWRLARWMRRRSISMAPVALVKFGKR